MARPRAIFFGTPDFAVPSLEALADIADVRLVVTQPDRPAGRGLKVRPPPVKERAEALGLRVVQPTKIRTDAFLRELAAEAPDVSLVTAYGRILPGPLLDAPRHGSINVHASLLPRWRGAAPIQWSIVRGDAETGVTLMKMDEGLDTGPVLAVRRIPIPPDATAVELAETLARLGGELVREDLPRYLAGGLEPVPQDVSRATLAPLLEKESGRIDWSRPSRAIHDLVRGMQPWPRATTRMAGERVVVHATAVGTTGRAGAPPGTLLGAGAAGLEVATGDGVLLITALQLEGRKRLSAREFCAAMPWPRGARFDGTETSR